MNLPHALLQQPALADLPVVAVLPQLLHQLRERPQALGALVAPPGSGKTLLAPWAWLQGLGLRRVLVLVPRRVNARLPYLFLRTWCGAAVGYRVRQEAQWEERSVQVGYLTYGTALRALADQPPGPDQGVLFDELHERPWEADLLLAHWRGLPPERRPRLLLMSATLDTDRLPAETVVVRSQGRLHSVQLSHERHDPQLLAQPDRLSELMAQRSAELAREHPGEQLLFLPGLASLRALAQRLEADPLPGPVELLHSSLPESELRRVVESPATGFRRVLSTDLAESSVTLPGVRTVIDSGLQRRPRSSGLGLGLVLETRRAPRSSLEQRAGRAGRLGPGRCHRLLTLQDELHRDPFGAPEIHQVDSKALALNLAALGHASDWQQLPWLDPPNVDRVAQGKEWAARQGLLEGDRLSPTGKAVLASGCSPRAGLFAVLARQADWPVERLVDWVSALELPLANPAGLRGQTLEDRLKHPLWRSQRDPRLLEQWRRSFQALQPNPALAATGGPPLRRAYRDAVVELRGERAVSWQPEIEALLWQPEVEALAQRFALALATVPTGRGQPESALTLLAPLAEEEVWEEMLEELTEERTLEWQGRAQRLIGWRRTRLGRLVLEQERVPVEPGAEAASALRQALPEGPREEAFLALCRRLRLYLEAYPEQRPEWLPHHPDLPLEQLAESFWDGYLHTLTAWDEAARQGLLPWMRQQLPAALWYRLEQELPESVRLPGRARPVPVVYPEQGDPYVASKLQDFFGWTPPRLLGGRLALACHLLAPSGRPVQITNELTGFWKGSYQAIRKELRGRYPKHAWPEAP